MKINDPSWHPLPVCSDARSRPWLLDRGSLTRRMPLRCENFRLDVHSQRMAATLPDERAVVGLRRGAHYFEREASLNCGQDRLVFAHSVVSRRALRLLAARPAEMWARRSLFGLRGSPLLVTKVFLPAILALAP